MARYLLVDEAPAVRRSLATQVRLADRYAHIQEAASTQEAGARCRSASFDVLFVGLGIASGKPRLALVERLLRDPNQVVVVCTSAPQTHPAVAKALSKGAFAYLPKPTRAESVRRVLQDLERERGRFQRIAFQPALAYV